MLCKELIEINERESFRKLDEHRTNSIVHYPNIVEAFHNNSSVIAIYRTIKVVPYFDKPNEGYFQINILNGKNDVLMTFLNYVYLKTKAVDLRALVIKPGIEVLNVSIDIRIIETDGNLYSLCIDAINAVINTLQLKKLFVPKILTYSLLDNKIISDPDAKEIEFSTWFYSIVMKSSREIIWSEKIGGELKINDIKFLIDKALIDYK